MTKTILSKMLLLTAMAFVCANTGAQVTVGSNAAPAATLDVVAVKTDGTTAEGIIFPRLTLAQLNAKQSKYTIAQRGTQVYIYDYTGATVPGYSDEVGCIGLYLFDGTKWRGSCGAVPDWIAIAGTVKRFTFYEDLTSATVAPLTFSAAGSGTIEYQWFRITGNNIHVRIAQKIASTTGTGNGAGYNTNSFTPIVKVGDGNTKNANNTGFYRFFCRAYNKVGGIRVDSVESAVAEIAVGCGAKDLNGEWLSFMCFNLGASELTIAAQKGHTFAAPTNEASGLHNYRTGEEEIYGDLYQWGRIRDGHQEYASSFTNGSNLLNAVNNTVTYSTSTPPTYADGALIGTSRYPSQQIPQGDATYFGKFIITTATQNHNWAFGVPTGTIDQMWRAGRYEQNDPCAKIEADGITYQTPFPTATPTSTATNWKIPTQDEWGALYKGGTFSGSPDNALANTWTWHAINGRGYDVMPDGTTVTLHLPASGFRQRSSGRLYYHGSHGYYWSSTFSGVDAYDMHFYSGRVNPANISPRGNGVAVRCIRNS
jgi:uncharacterized protein (TIGR02145 family)